MRVDLDELEFPSKCRNCGSNRFVVEGYRKRMFRLKCTITKERIHVDEETTYPMDFVDEDIVNKIYCDVCGEDLSDEYE